MSGLKPLSARKLIKILSKIGFQVTRQKGSHIFLKHPDGRRVVVPMHPNEDIDRGLLRRIIREINLTREEFIKLLEDY
ncbi:MAG: type II toxin-antitoxin system HicA family toxin [Candidatus Aenigmarchaeota archaeon]|nr:type II toxin-antitoxin system HicA family toxin [Candidatus Aenigmarchaeota archaeon]